MDEVIVVSYGEIILKGLNRPNFEQRLIKNIKNAIKDFGDAKVSKSQARIFIEPLQQNYDFDAAITKLTKVFGIVSLSRAYKIKSDMDEIRKVAVRVALQQYENDIFKTFKVETRRGNKSFELNSPQINADVGGYVLDNVPDLKVDVISPDFKIFIEVRDYTYIYTTKKRASGGMPLGTNGKAVLLLSGGIDSPVAGWMIAKRGVEIEAVHFFSHPYTSERAKQKVINLCEIISEYCGKIRLNIVHFTDIQLAIYKNCPEKLTTMIMRRVMMRIAEHIANKVGANALITGESIGQVASQTIQALAATDAVVGMSVFRPLIGMDKEDIVNIAKKINTYNTSILPYQDCCTIFVPKHPDTKPKIERLDEAEKRFNMDELILKAIENIELIEVGD